VSVDRTKVLEAAQKHLAAGAFDKAIVEFQKLVAADPSDIRTWLKIGDLQSKVGKTKDAIDTYLRVADQYSAQGFHLKAVAVHKQILKLDPNRIDVQFKLARAYEGLQLTSEALSTYEIVAGAQARAGDVPGAVATLGRMVELDPESVPTRIKYAEALSRTGRTLEAADAFEAGGKLLKAQGRMDDYLKVGERLLYHREGDLTLSRELAELYLERDDAKRALAKLQSCFKADSKDVRTLELLARAFQQLGQLPKTISVYREAARIHGEAGQQVERAAMLKRILELDPGDAEARQALASFAAQPKPAAAPRRDIALPPGAVVAPSASSAAVPSEPPDEMDQTLIGEPLEGSPDDSADGPSADDAEVVFVESDDVELPADEANVDSEAGGEEASLEEAAVEAASAEGDEDEVLIIDDAEADIPTAEGAPAEAPAGGAAAGDAKPSQTRPSTFRADTARASLPSPTATRPSDHPSEPSRSAPLRSVAPLPRVLPDEPEGEAAPRPASQVPRTSSSRGSSLGSSPGSSLGSSLGSSRGSSRGSPLGSSRGSPLGSPLGSSLGSSPGSSAGSSPGVAASADAAAVSAALRSGSGRASLSSLPPDVAREAQLAKLLTECDVYLRYGLKQKVLDQLRRVLEIEPRHIEARERLKEILLERGDRAGAAGELVALADLLGESRPQIAALYLRQALELDPASAEASKRLEATPGGSVADTAESPLDRVAVEPPAPAMALVPRPPPRLDESPEASVLGADDGDEGGVLFVDDEPATGADAPERTELGPEVDLLQPMSPEEFEQAPLRPSVEGIETGAESIRASRPSMPAGEVEELLDEAEFFVAQGLYDEALAMLVEARNAYPKNVLIRDKVAEIEEARALAQAAQPTPPATDRSYELAEKLAEEIETSDAASAPAPGSDVLDVEQVFAQFKKGVAEQIAPDDTSTHFDLGIAYKEMGRLQDAIAEFELCIANPARQCISHTMIGLCHMEKRDAQSAIKHFKRGLYAEQKTDREELGLYFELGAAYELLGDPKEANYYYEKVKKRDPAFRNVEDRIRRLAAPRPAAAEPDDVDAAFDDLVNKE
jgi:pilus assembly protein FimV